ncbi:8-oxo-dGTP pyrophosphatase MutT (NUDIX family) [Catenuloplanes nepalensis]|uniref:8-oxo-dGTP pyrophosphatase MutT (NUDIX family) n=1 Tax=Catenuloplanes nepalensis TaxID=587533 RepID=A0ABT9N7B1_9ACTN|nr:hypothetical protein [Catenuloplanes nepalensis]MDP9799568.1 8-oxo-dGTP pyrophosphatase MutT (NUDIX family) [Catenuloplanes nepalensis]
MDPEHVIFYTGNGEARQEFSVVFTARPVGGQPKTSDESREVRWTPPEDIPALIMDRSMRTRIMYFLSGDGVPHLG